MGPHGIALILFLLGSAERPSALSFLLSKMSASDNLIFDWSVVGVGSPKQEMLCKRCACHEIGTCFRTLELIFKLVVFVSQFCACPVDAAASTGHGRIHWTRPRPLDVAASTGHDRHPEHPPSSCHPQGGPIGSPASSYGSFKPSQEDSARCAGPDAPNISSGDPFLS